MTDVGIARRTLTVELQDPRKSQQTSPVRRADRMRVNVNSRVDSSMNRVVSKTVRSFIP